MTEALQATLSAYVNTKYAGSCNQLSPYCTLEANGEKPKRPVCRLCESSLTDLALQLTFGNQKDSRTHHI